MSAYKRCGIHKQMGLRERYETLKSKLLSDTSICRENRELFRQFFEYEQYKLKRQNQMSDIDEPSCKTLYGYVTKLRNVNQWFKNKPWTQLTKDDIREVYDALEDGQICSSRGTRFKDRWSYYNKIFKSKPFRMAGKADLAREVIEFAVPATREVRFVTEETFRKLVSVVSNPRHLLLFWLAWDIGENIGALLLLTKREFSRQINPHTQEPEYLVNLPRGKIKRSRLSRSEPTLYPETVNYADIVLANLQDEELVFPFGHRQALKVMHRAVRLTNALCQPNQEPVTWKDLRSGMASHLLRKGWTREEVDARLGHTANSSALNAYISYLAIDRSAPKRRMFESDVERLKSRIESEQSVASHTAERLHSERESNQKLQLELQQTARDVQTMKESIRQIMTMLKTSTVIS